MFCKWIRIFCALFLCSAMVAEAQLVRNGSLRPDINGDGTVDLNDFFVFADGFARDCVPSEPLAACPDLDGDGSVGFADFFLLADDFGRIEPFFGSWERVEVDEEALLRGVIRLGADGLFVGNFWDNDALRTISVFPYSIAADTLTLGAGLVFSAEEDGEFSAVEDLEITFVRFVAADGELTLFAGADPRDGIVYAASGDEPQEPPVGFTLPALPAAKRVFGAAWPPVAAGLRRFSLDTGGH